ncbi:IS630 family transposase [Spartinivicinus sp. A2-2]|uniref:IS630 family transposase n=1 Tax=Spartinivicinus poritis TaxID=2994640 RepID=A0ABT5UI52_9GAMM|nr:IS630 family transposase [Spartinivicinus sp. A2-2]MDE1466041.1 IS630 family transposase [Spartinivicinus sp. A2-2]
MLGSGWTLQEVKEALLLDDETLRGYVNRYRQGGVSELLKSHHKGSQSKLSDEQKSCLRAELDNHIHLSTGSVCCYVEATFGIKYSISGMTDFLHQLGYRYKKPKLVPANPNIHAQEEFLEQYNQFMKTKRADEAVFFLDAMHPTHCSEAAYGWIKKGQEKTLKANTGRSRYNIHGAMNAETLETVALFSEDNINADSTIDLFNYLESVYPQAQTIYVIADNV